MGDLKAMFEKMSSVENGDGGGDAQSVLSKQKGPAKQTIEETYQKKSQLEHILLRPDTYIGSVEQTTEMMWVYDAEKETIVQKQISYVPGLYKIFDEILVNAADNKQRDKSMDCIKIEINPDTNTISVWNNGQGIPVTKHKEEKMFVPTLIFGHLLTSSNYNDEEEKVTGGRNGYGAKLCNIFSTKFTVETGTIEYKSQFRQTWGSNMTKTSEPKVKEFTGSDFTKVTFCPDLVKFKMDKLDNDIVSLMSRRAFDVAASTRGVKVFLNGKRVPVKTFKDYIDLYIKNDEDDSGNALKIIHEVVNERWEVALTLSDRGFQQMSFVNSIATTKGGRHVDYVTDMIVKQLIEILKKKNKGGVNIKPHQVKTHMWIFVNCLIVNPTFDSQTKENMTLQMKNFGSKCNLSEKFITAVTKSGIVESVLTWAKFKADTELTKVSGKKLGKLKIPKLEDAIQAGTKNSMKCTLFLTEGDSAKSLVMSGLSVIGHDLYGVFPLRGKLLNVREATHKQILDNAEINNLIKILGLQYKKKYNDEDDLKSLRYGKVMIMTDQDQDGSHIKGLVINFIHCNWPELIQQNFLEEFITPIVKAKKKGQQISFYSLPEFEEWKRNTHNHHTYNIKYYKGLGTSDSKEAKEYFSNMLRHRIRFRYQGQTDDDHILLAFSKKHIEHRKEWLTNFMVESKRRKEAGLAERYLYTKDTKFISFTDFVNLELVLFSNMDNVRSIPCLVDGFKPGQRKVLFTCIKRNDKREVKVAQLSGSVAEHSAYHHGEVSLCMTIVNLAQNYVGSNNINLLEPRGQFGTRLAGGKDSASPRYIFTKMSPLTRLIFHPHDDHLLKHEYDDNQKIEPVWYIPIIPMLLVNGADGIGTGWMTKIPNYNPREIVENLKLIMNGDDPVPMLPWYKNFKGTIEDAGDGRYVVSGEIAIIGQDRLEITELPIGMWTQNYKENVLEPMLHGSEKVKVAISDYKEYNTDVTVKFVISCLPGKLESMEKEGLHKVFKLQSMINTSSMCAFDELGCLRRFDSVMDILQEFYAIRMKMYIRRKEYLEGMLQAEADRLSNQARFIMEKCSGELVVENKKRKTIVDELLKKDYKPDPVKEWKTCCLQEEEEEETQAEENEDDDVQDSEKKKSSDSEFKNSTDVKQFDYLLGMSFWMLTEERKNELLKQRDSKLADLDTLRRKTPSCLWKEDLNAFLEKLDIIEEKERKEEGAVTSKETKKGGMSKKKMVADVMPSPNARRVAPTISDEIKKKIQTAQKYKENRVKKSVKKENIAEDDVDEFDQLVADKTGLKEKLLVKKEGEKTKKSKDGYKQTKLDFKKKQTDPKVNGSPKKKARRRRYSISDDEDDFLDGSDPDVEFVSRGSLDVGERTVGRRIAKPVKYNIDSSSGASSGDEQVLFDNDAVKSEGVGKQGKMSDSSDSEAEKPLKKTDTSDDLFDSLIGKKPDMSPLTEKLPPPKIISKPQLAQKINSNENDVNMTTVSSDTDAAVVKPKKPPVKRKQKIIDSDSDSDEPIKKKRPTTKKSTVKKAKETKGGKKEPVKKKKNDVDDDFKLGDNENINHSEDSSPIKVGRAVRQKKVTKYVFDESD